MVKPIVDDKNLAFMQAVSFVNQTNQHLFLTGKAGTGKTTFLKYIRENCHKKMAITAPTGVAAMNAGGTTLHALFWLPFGTFIEDYPLKWDEQDSHIYNKSRLFSTIKLTKQRRAILQELELLVIDEVSMVRADTLDAIDVILKSVRRDMRPFGGVQMLFIGDLYQLPPVVREQEWQVLRDHYSSPFFFDAKVLREHPPVLLELNKIYRQNDADFIGLLNNIRNNKCTQADLDTLNAHYREGFSAPEGEQYITLTSHNKLADAINQNELARLPGVMHNVRAVVKDEFQQSSFPAEEVLPLKTGAQVMFIKNDSGEDRKYFNGKIGVVKELNLDRHQVVVGFPDGSEDVVVRRETWENIRYKYNKGEDKIEEEVLGTFSQFPLRLAWAITIHKSQGLTFDKAIIDAGTSFAAGQVYVALSRLTGLGGLVLRSKIPLHAIRTDFQVVDFMNRMASADETSKILERCQRQYLGQILLQSFRWNSLVEQVDELKEAFVKRNIEGKEKASDFIHGLSEVLREQEKVGNKFITQLYVLLQDKEQLDYQKICERTKSAVNWFLPQFNDRVLLPTQDHLDEWKVKKRTKKYVDELRSLLLDFRRKKDQLSHCLTIADILTREGDLSEAVHLVGQQEKAKDNGIKEADDDNATKDTKAISLDMFLDGLGIDEIAKKRDMVVGTIYGHLIHYVGTEVEATDLIAPDKLDKVLQVIRDNPGKSSSELKVLLGSDFDYPDIKIGQRVMELEES
ncbi:helix-turn-helix protein [Sphingobacterium allocomposti]|uniref:Helix-turn-helix protein n=1 Tax=Sphingobacterium allocomposti TaxID=415956 RepID=A0A5S5CWT3_9SPHI|nr:helix-turn-helix domain-containing protein [Sphingobacterium composti Yoo et al. 2007 non Ten et al. 2007]TYP88271.1 helix-turn-helix protein [Sphingobacterium composti Yoo et al. 2007 non Ten et al. 2007]HLS94684.1 helix-turn-helix domain-containing protein [Sphingobacterium sp.]